jgi:UDP-N-acetylmuramate--alanine ligase
VREAFLNFSKQVSSKGAIVACGDDREIQKVLRETDKRVITYGFNSTNDYVLSRVTISGDQTFFWIESHGTSLGEFAIRVAGEHNAMNALAAFIVAVELGLSYERIKKTLGISWRASLGRKSL